MTEDLVSQDVRTEQLTGISSHSNGRSTRLFGLVLLTTFVVLRLPTLTTYYNYHYDEHFYTDGALIMMEGGDYLTPHYPDGTARFNKPPLTYWVVASSFKLLGISPLTSRLPFLIVGVLLLILTFHFASRVFGCDETALYATAVLACNATFFYHIGYAITDGLLSLWIVIGFYGFYRVLVEGDARRRWIVCGFMGTALAVATKGIPGMMPLGIAVIFLLWQGKTRDPQARHPLWRLVSIPGMLVFLLIAGAWPLAESLQNGDRFWHGFLNDQVAQRFEWSHLLGSLAYNGMLNCAYYPAVLFQYFFPWSLLVLYVLIRQRRELGGWLAKLQPKWCYIAMACAVNLIFYLPPNIHRCRYLLPVFPFLSMAIVAVLQRAQFERLIARMLVLLCGLEVLAGVALGLSGPGGHALAAAALVLLAVAFWFAARRWIFARPALAAVAIVLAFSAFDWAFNAESAPCPSAELYARLREHNFTHGTVELGPRVMYELPAHVRVLSGGKIDFKPIAGAGPHNTVLLNEKWPIAVPMLADSETVREPIGGGLHSGKEAPGRIMPGRNNDRLFWLLSGLMGGEAQFSTSRRDQYVVVWAREAEVAR